jgi:hypothetical protein
MVPYCAPVIELPRAEILEPVLRAFHAVEHALRAIGKWYHGVLYIGRQFAVDKHIAFEESSKGVRVNVCLQFHAGEIAAISRHDCARTFGHRWAAKAHSSRTRSLGIHTLSTQAHLRPA